MRGYELEPCPKCGGEMRWYNLTTIGERVVKGYVMCADCGRKVGEGLEADEKDGDLRPILAELANRRQ